MRIEVQEPPRGEASGESIMHTNEELKKRIAELEAAIKHEDERRRLKLHGLATRLRAYGARKAAEHPIVTLPYFEARKVAEQIGLPHFDKGTERIDKVAFPHFREAVKNVVHSAAEHVRKVNSNRAFALGLRQGQTGYNQYTGDTLIKDKNAVEGYRVIGNKKRVIV